MYMSYQTDGTPPTITGWVALAGGGIYRRVANSEPANYSMNGGASALASSATIDAYTGVDNTTPEDVAVPARTTGSTAAVSWPSITPAADNAWMHAAFFEATPSDVSAMGVPSGYTQRTNSGAGGLTSFSKLVTPPAAQAPTGTDPAGSPFWVAGIVALRPAAGGGGVSPGEGRFTARAVARLF